MATPIQIIAALTIENAYHILYPTAPKNYSQFEDITDWAGLGYTTGNGDVVKGIFKVIDPVGQVIYENSGYASDVFSSQDWDLTDLVAPQFNLLTYTGTDTPVYGDYTFLWKVQVTPNGLSAFVVEKEFIIGLSNQLSPTLSLEDVYDCDYATFTSTDTTTYGAPAGYTIQSITKTHVTRPPLVSKKSDGVTAQPTVTSSSTTNLLSAPDNPLWTGAYSSSISAIITYKSGNNYTIVNCPAVEKDTTVTCDTSLCKLFCYLKKLYTKYFDFLAVGNTVEANMALSKWQKGSDIFVMIWKATTCSTGDVESLTKKFYDVTGFTEGCDCGCDGDMPAPVIPTNVINGTDGTDGLTAEFRVTGTLFQWRYTTGGGWTTLFDFSTITGLNGTSFLQGSGVPSSGLGENGDSYLDIGNGDVYLKTAGAWAVTGNINGAVVLQNQFPNLSTLSTNFESLLVGRVPYDLPANKLMANGDELLLFAQFSSANPAASYSQAVKLSFAGTDLLGAFDLASFYSLNVGLIKLYARIVRTSNTTVNYQLTIQYFGDTNTPSITRTMLQQTQTDITGLGTLNLTTTSYEIDALAKSVVIGDITCEAFEVIYNHQS